MQETRWLYCPICSGKTRNQVRRDTVLIRYPLYCPKCKRETLVNVKEFELKRITEPDASDAEPIDP